MKKIKKPLLINLPQDHPQVKSPTHNGYKQTKQRSFLLYNEHTVTSSANNQDELVEDHERQFTSCQQFTQFHAKDAHSKIQSVPGQQQTKNKFPRHQKFNVIEFQQFCVQEDQNKSLNSFHANHLSIHPYQKNQLKNHKKQFSIEIPDPEDKDQKKQLNAKFSFDLKSENASKSVKQNFPKQPPAPSNKSKLSKTLNRHFVFPTNDQQKLHQTLGKKEDSTDKIVGKVISVQQHQTIVKQLSEQWNEKVEQINKSFERERQQFYKEKSSLEKDLMIKDGQIQMLQKLITNRYSPKQATLTNNNYSNPTDKQQASYKVSFNTDHQKRNLYISDEKVNAMETILLQKDLEINTLLEKINQLNSMIDKKNNQLEDVKVSLLKSQKINESLTSEIFLFEKKDSSQKLTKQFYKVKQSLIQSQQTSKTPKGFSRSKWQQDVSLEKQKSKETDKSDYPFRGIDDLHKRLESLKMNRIQLQSRGRIKSEIGYPQTSKNKSKGTFDFKGKFYDRQRDYISRGGNY